MLPALAVTVSLLCAAAFADEVPRPEAGKAVDTNRAIFGVTVRIVYEEEGCRGYIKSAGPDDFS